MSTPGDKPRAIRSNQFLGERHDIGKRDFLKKDAPKISKNNYRSECLDDEEINPQK
ncbi:MAG: hypothetical protein ACI8PD_002256 [Nitrospinales bacterium]|jgi:hypothetical protein